MIETRERGPSGLPGSIPGVGVKMSPLIVEVYSSEEKKWLQLPCLRPYDRPGSMSDNKENGKRDVYIFECSKDDSYSVIYHSKFGLDRLLKEDLRECLALGKLEVVRVLRKEESYEIMVKTDISREKRRIRFTHRKA